MAHEQIAFYQNILKGNYIKGANTLRGVMKNIEEADTLTNSSEAMTVIFETSESGGLRLLPDIFYASSMFVGKGFRTAVRARDPNFDPTNILTTLQTTLEITQNNVAMLLIDGHTIARELFTTISYPLGTIAANDVTSFNSVLATTNLRSTHFISNAANFLVNSLANTTVKARIADDNTLMAELLTNNTSRGVIISNGNFIGIAIVSPYIMDLINTDSTLRSVVVNNPSWRTAIAQNNTAATYLAQRERFFKDFMALASSSDINSFQQKTDALNTLNSSPMVVSIVIPSRAWSSGVWYRPAEFPLSRYWVCTWRISLSSGTPEFRIRARVGSAESESTSYPRASLHNTDYRLDRLLHKLEGYANANVTTPWTLRVIPID